MSMMLRNNGRKILVGVLATLLVLSAAGIGVKNYIASQVNSRIARAIPGATGINSSIGWGDIAPALTGHGLHTLSGSIKDTPVAGFSVHPEISFTATNVATTSNSVIGSLDIAATIPTKSITGLVNFPNAQVVNHTLVIAIDGLNTSAVMVPAVSNNAIYFQLQSVKVLGATLTGSSIPAAVQAQVKAKSSRQIKLPTGLKIQSASLQSSGLLVKMHADNFDFANIGTSFQSS